MGPCLLSLFSCLTMAAAPWCSSIDFSLFVCSEANGWARSITLHSSGKERAEAVAAQPIPLTAASVKAIFPPGVCVGLSALGGCVPETVAFSQGLCVDE